MWTVCTRYKTAWLLSGIAAVGFTENVQAVSAPNVVLANNYKDSLRLDQYWMSEKLDGIRAFWTGRQLLTRKGNRIFAPDWFTQSLPAFPVEGELWAGRGNFHVVQNTVLDHVPDHDRWKDICLMLFDIPGLKQPYTERLRRLTQLVERSGSPYIGYIEHTPVASESAMLEFLESLQKLGGEGVMLRRADSHYLAGRGDDLIKLKKHQDAEAKVIGYRPGNGKYAGAMGAVHVQMNNGRTFYIGSGFTDEMRDNPPPIGAIITYRFNGYTSTGLPRFARFLRVRRD